MNDHMMFRFYAVWYLSVSLECRESKHVYIVENKWAWIKSPPVLKGGFSNNASSKSVWSGLLFCLNFINLLLMIMNQSHPHFHISSYNMLTNFFWHWCERVMFQMWELGVQWGICFGCDEMLIYCTNVVNEIAFKLYSK